MMNEVNVDTGFLGKAAALLNNTKLSDLEIQVFNKGAFQTSYPAHKLFLAMNSGIFANKFYGSSETDKVFKIFDYEPKIVFMMLEFIYTDETDVSNIVNTNNLYRLAKKYEIKDLEKYCLKNLATEKLTLKNIFDKYEFAITENIPEALKACRECASIHTMDIIQSDQFAEAALPVVEDFLQLDTLSVMSELDLIEAIIKWGQQECYRRGSQTENLRICVYPLFKHLRFLTLSPHEFCDLVEKYDKLLNSHESSLLTRAIIQPGVGVKLPSGFSSNSNPRRQVNSDPHDKLLIPTADRNMLPISTSVGANNDKNWSFDSELQDHLRDNFGLKNTKDFNSKSVKNDEYDGMFSQPNIRVNVKQGSNSVKRSVNNDQFPQFRQNSSKQNSTSNLIKFDENLPHYRKYPTVTQDLNASSLKLAQNVESFSLNAALNKVDRPSPATYNRSDSVPIHIKKTSPTFSKKQSLVNRVSPSPYSSFSLRSFDFPLFGFDRPLGMSSALKNDIKCQAKVNVNRGAIEIHGIEIKIKQRELDDVVEAHLTLTGSNIPTRSTTYEQKLRNSVMFLTFKEPVKLSGNDHLNVEVVVEDLTLNRCLGCRDEMRELNVGLGLSAEIRMKSNQVSNDSQEFFYLFNRLMYKPLS